MFFNARRAATATSVIKMESGPDANWMFIINETEANHQSSISKRIVEIQLPGIDPDNIKGRAKPR